MIAQLVKTTVEDIATFFISERKLVTNKTIDS